MVNAVASRVIPRQRISKAMAKEAAAEASRIKSLARSADAPLSVGKIPSRAGDSYRTANVGLRPMGNSRRIFLLDPYLDSGEMEGLAHRIHALTNNEAINSVLIASDDEDDAEMNCLPRYITDLNSPKFGGINLDYDPLPGSTWHVSGGYDPLKIGAGDAEDLLDSLRKLAIATKGEASGNDATRVPVISMPHGMVTDGGYALCMGGYVIATRQTSFRIMNPSRGLSFDPVGFSFLFPRLGMDHQQRSSKYSGCGMLLALAGYEANCFDMVETGLATHLVSDSAALPLLEENLASLEPWDQQRLVKNPVRGYGQPLRNDANAAFRNKSIAYMIEQLSDHSSSSVEDSLPYDFEVTNANDPAFDIDQVPWDSGFFSSDLVDTAAHFDTIFKKGDSVEGIMDLLRQAGDAPAESSEDKENCEIAREVLGRMERQSPLALAVIHRLMALGKKPSATMQECMNREMLTQINMIQQTDFQAWLEHVREHGGELKAPAFTGWKHASVKDVSKDEVESILNEKQQESPEKLQ